jgi:transposase
MLMAPKIHKSKKVQEYLKENKDSLRIVYLPKGSPQFNTVKEC